MCVNGRARRDAIAGGFVSYRGTALEAAEKCEISLALEKTSRLNSIWAFFRNFEAFRVIRATEFSTFSAASLAAVVRTFSSTRALELWHELTGHHTSVMSRKFFT